MRPLADFGLSRHAEAETIPAVLHQNFYLWVNDLQEDIPPELEIRFPGPNEPRPIARAQALWEKHRVRPRTVAEEEADRDLTWARIARNDICKIMPQLRGRYWSDDELDLFGLSKEDLVIPLEPTSGKDRHEIDQQYARIMNAFEKAKQTPHAERAILILTRRVDRLEAKLKEMQQ